MICFKLLLTCLPELGFGFENSLPQGQFFFLNHRALAHSIQGSHGSPAMKFPDLFLTFSWQSPNFYWLFAAWKYDILTFAGIHIWIIEMKKKTKKHCSDHLAKKNKDGLSFYVLYQLNHIIYKMSNYGNTFSDFLAFLLATVRLSYHIMTLTVKIWDEAFIIIIMIMIVIIIITITTSDAPCWNTGVRKWKWNRRLSQSL